MNQELHHFLSSLFRNEIERVGDCWVWQGSTTSGGSPLISLGKKSVFMVRRVVYAILRGPIPSGRTITCICATQHCINPHHIGLGKPMKIIDEFSDLPVSRECKRQYRQLKRGLCAHTHCSLPLATARYCKSHAIDSRERKRMISSANNRYNSLSYRIRHTPKPRVVPCVGSP